MKAVFVFLLSIKLIASTPTPIVLWHGMGDTCCVSFSLGGFKTYLENQIPGVYVKSLRIGKSFIEDLENSYFMKPDLQIIEACKILSEDPKLVNGFNAIGFSQGSQFLRGVVQRCGDKLKIKTLVSLGGQHQGIYGIPHCAALQKKSCDYIRKLLNHAAYTPWVQKHLVQATYWHDPLAEETYREKSEFLADINNERHINLTYVQNINKLDYFVLVKFDNDTIVQPRETEWFGFYVPGQAVKTYTLKESRLYLEDRLGLQQMDRDGKLIFLSTPNDHLRFTDEWFTSNIIKPYLLTSLHINIKIGGKDDDNDDWN